MERLTVSLESVRTGNKIPCQAKGQKRNRLGGSVIAVLT